MFLLTLNKKGLKIVDNLKIIHHLVKLLLFITFFVMLSLKTQKKHVKGHFVPFDW